MEGKRKVADTEDRVRINLYLLDFLKVTTIDLKMSQSNLLTLYLGYKYTNRRV